MRVGYEDCLRWLRKAALHIRFFASATIKRSAGVDTQPDRQYASTPGRTASCYVAPDGAGAAVGLGCDFHHHIDCVDLSAPDDRHIVAAAIEVNANSLWCRLCTARQLRAMSQFIGAYVSVSLI